MRTWPDLGFGVGTVLTSTVQSATEVPLPGEVTIRRFISVGISLSMVVVGFVCWQLAVCVEWSS